MNMLNTLSLSLQERCSSHLIILHALYWTYTNKPMSFPWLCWGLQAWLQYCKEGFLESRVDGDNRFPCPAGHACFHAAQGRIGLLGCRCLLLTHVQVFIHKNPQVLLCSQRVHSSVCADVCTSHLALLSSVRFYASPLLQSAQPLWMHPFLLLYQLHHSAWSCMQTCMRVHLLPLSASLLMILSITSLNMDSWPGCGLLTTALWTQVSSQFLIHQTIHSSNSTLSNLVETVFCETLPDACLPMHTPQKRISVLLSLLALFSLKHFLVLALVLDSHTVEARQHGGRDAQKRYKLLFPDQLSTDSNPSSLW